MTIDVVVTLGNTARAKATSEVDNYQDDDDHNGNHILHNGADVAGECHLATSPGFFILTSIVMIRGLCRRRALLASLSTFLS